MIIEAFASPPALRCISSRSRYAQVHRRTGSAPYDAAAGVAGRFHRRGQRGAVVDAFVNALDLAALGFEGVQAAETRRPSYQPTVLLKIYVNGDLHCVQSSRRLERECQRNLEVMWLTGRLAPDFKIIADFRRDNGKGIRGGEPTPIGASSTGRMPLRQKAMASRFI